MLSHQNYPAVIKYIDLAGFVLSSSDKLIYCLLVHVYSIYLFNSPAGTWKELMEVTTTLFLPKSADGQKPQLRGINNPFTSISSLWNLKIKI